MQLAQNLPSLMPLPNLDDVRHLIQSSLQGNWIVRVEHSDQILPRINTWQQWHKPLFALRDPEPVIEQIIACYAGHPHHSIRISAECTRPETRLVYSVYSPEIHSAEVISLAKGNLSVVKETSAIHVWKRLGDNFAGLRQKAWRYLAVVSTVLASLLLLQETVMACI